MTPPAPSVRTDRRAIVVPLSRPRRTPYANPRPTGSRPALLRRGRHRGHVPGSRGRVDFSVRRHAAALPRHLQRPTDAPADAEGVPVRRGDGGADLPADPPAAAGD